MYQDISYKGLTAFLTNKMIFLNNTIIVLFLVRNSIPTKELKCFNNDSSGCIMRCMADGQMNLIGKFT